MPTYRIELRHDNNEDLVTVCGELTAETRKGAEALSPAMFGDPVTVATTAWGPSKSYAHAARYLAVEVG